MLFVKLNTTMKDIQALAIYSLHILNNNASVVYDYNCTNAYACFNQSNTKLPRDSLRWHITASHTQGLK